MDNYEETNKKTPIDQVIVTFVDEDAVEKKRLTLNDFSFLKSRQLLKNVKGNISDAVIWERRD